jgi:broad specificity phosphatase PhoE
MEAAAAAGKEGVDVLDALANPELHDARLTEMGLAQALGLAKVSEKAPHLSGTNFPQLIVSSPLSRCLETATLAFGLEDRADIPLCVAHDAFRER